MGRRRTGLLLLCTGGVAALCALGVWQVERLAWKLDLVRRIDAHLQAPPVEAPDGAQWASRGADEYVYRHVRVSGVYLYDDETQVQAVTRLGAGCWVLTPLRTASGRVVLVNRGFVPAGRCGPPMRAGGRVPGTTVVSGLLRQSEPRGAFLRSNDPGAGRWYSRDVAAIAAARGLGDVAPYFIDADADASAPAEGAPVGGLTVVKLPNNHLVYAITWFSLALVLAVAGWRAQRVRTGSLK